MKLAEALITRADLLKKIGQIRKRMTQSAMVQEGETPAEEVEVLLVTYDELMSELCELIKKVNHTNGMTSFGSGSIADAIAERDNLRSRISAHRDLYEAATVQQNRYSRSEIKYVRCVDAAELQKGIDLLSKQYRELDTRIQEANWNTDLQD